MITSRRHPNMQVSDLQNYLEQEYSSHLRDEPAAQSAIRLLKLAKARGFDPGKAKSRNPINNDE